MTKQSLEQKSKYLSFLLRHKPQAANIKLDKQGWCSIEQLVTNTDITFAELQEIVKTDSKGRYSFDDQNPHRATAIRANQGHSTKEVQLTFSKDVPQPILYHGTTESAYQIIKTEGLKPMSRQYVHLSDDLETAKSVAARRRADTVILKVDVNSMLRDGHEFFRSENGVWLARAVDAKYISREL